MFQVLSIVNKLLFVPCMTIIVGK